MAEVSWIKISTDICSNRKISILLKDKEGDMYFRIWIQLLTLAGQCNMNGKLIIGERTPIDIKQLSQIIGKSVPKMQKIMNKFIELRMIDFREYCFSIKNWSKYQSVDKLS